MRSMGEVHPPLGMALKVWREIGLTRRHEGF